VRKASFALLAIVSITIPSLSQDVTPERECGDAFRRIDINNDGVITHTEIPKARELPSEFAKASLVGRGEFMAACVKVAQAKQAERQAASAPPAEKPQDQTGPAK
jgi:hypothetical protein